MYSLPPTISGVALKPSGIRARAFGADAPIGFPSGPMYLGLSNASQTHATSSLETLEASIWSSGEYFDEARSPEYCGHSPSAVV